MKPLLAVSGITKSFAGVHALRGVSFDLQPGEVHALVGENGAGKSTLIKVITGAHAPDAGSIEIDGHPVHHNSPLLSHSLGIAAIYQQPALFPDLSVAENIALRLEPHGGWRLVRWGERRRRASPHHGRADGVSQRARGGAALPRQPRPARPRRRYHLRLAQAGRTVP